METALIGSPLGSVVVALAATFLALSLLVQVLQELWKYVRSTKADCYTRVLEDFLGPWARRMTRPGVLPEFQARGPFQFRRLGPTGQLLPLGREQLVEGLERTAAPWHRRALRALRLEAELQPSGPAVPSMEWERLLRELGATEAGGPGDAEAWELRSFLAANDLGSSIETDAEPRKTMDASRGLRVFRERFFPHVLDAERHFARLGELFEYQYRRRNTVLTLVFGFVVAFAFDQPFQHILDRARAMSPQQAAALADDMLQLYDAAQTEHAGGPAIDSSLAKLVGTLNNLAREETATPSVVPSGFREFGGAPWLGRLGYLAGCLLTAVLVSFGAPVWNDLVGALAGLRRTGTPRLDEPAPVGPRHD